LWDLSMSQHSGSVSPLSEHPASPALLTNLGPHRHTCSPQQQRCEAGPVQTQRGAGLRPREEHMPPKGARVLWQRGRAHPLRQPSVYGQQQESTRTQHAQFPRGAQGTPRFAQSQAPARPRRVRIGSAHSADLPRTWFTKQPPRKHAQKAMENQVLHWPQATSEEACLFWVCHAHSQFENRSRREASPGCLSCVALPDVTTQGCGCTRAQLS